jgi:hypothetical protein
VKKPRFSIGDCAGIVLIVICSMAALTGLFSIYAGLSGGFLLGLSFYYLDRHLDRLADRK